MFDHISAPAGATGSLRNPPTPKPIPSTRDRINGLRAEWRRLARSLADPFVELGTEEFASVLACHSRLKAAGAAIDPMADALITQLAYQLAVVEACL